MKLDREDLFKITDLLTHLNQSLKNTGLGLGADRIPVFDDELLGYVSIGLNGEYEFES